MNDRDRDGGGLELLVEEPAPVARLDEWRRPEPDEADDGDEPPTAA
jgi:hypothetical protein